jgi:hypothetical protein
VVDVSGGESRNRMLLRVDRLLDATEVGTILHLERDEVYALSNRPVGDPLRLPSVGPNQKRKRWELAEVMGWVERRRNANGLSVYPDATGTDPPTLPVRRGPLPRTRGRPVRARKAH